MLPVITVTPQGHSFCGSPRAAAPVLFALSHGFWSTACATLPWLVLQKQSTANQHHRQSICATCRHPSRRVFLNPLKSPKSCISTGATSRQPHSCELPWGGWENTLRLFCPLFYVNREVLQSVNLWFFIFLPFLSLRALER